MRKLQKLIRFRELDPMITNQADNQKIWEAMESWSPMLLIHYTDEKSKIICLTPKEYVSLLISLYKDNGSVSCVGINFLLIRSLYLLRTQLLGAQST